MREGCALPVMLVLVLIVLVVRAGGFVMAGNMAGQIAARNAQAVSLWRPGAARLIAGQDQGYSAAPSGFARLADHRRIIARS